MHCIGILPDLPIHLVATCRGYVVVLYPLFLRGSGLVDLESEADTPPEGPLLVR
jgi:hypothetical protein